MGDYSGTVGVCKTLLRDLPQEAVEKKEVADLMKRAMEKTLHAKKLEERVAAVRELEAGE